LQLLLIRSKIGYNLPLKNPHNYTKCFYTQLFILRCNYCRPN
jgi:hypothetical protein